MKKLLIILCLVLISTGCAHTEPIAECTTQFTYNFWGGLWHGIIAIPDFIAMLIWPDKYCVYAPNNSGPWYAFGFLIGISIEVTGIYKSTRS